jgi:trans enoyl reductase
VASPGGLSSVGPVSPAAREFDIVVYGATGFSGKLTAEYLAHSGSNARIALAGRSRERLLAVRELLGPNAQDWPLIIADASQPSTLEAMATRAQVVLTTVGPYAHYGLPLVAACAKAGTDYADLTGELMFGRNSIDLYHKQAVDTGARIVLSCGFDSVPSDLNAYQLYRRAILDGTGQLGDTTLVLRSFWQTGVSGGSVATYLDAMRTASSDPEAHRLVDDPYTLTTDRGAEAELGVQPDFPCRRGREVAPELTGLWTGGFFQSPYNSRIVRRSNALQNWAYGRRFRYSETMSLGHSFAAPVFAAVVTAVLKVVFGLGNRYARLLPRRLVERIAPKPGTGPSAARRQRGHYTMETYTTTATGARYMATFAQQCDAYHGTSVLLGECGLALALDRDRLSELRGVLTPAAAMGDALLARLPAAGVSLATTRLS